MSMMEDVIDDRGEGQSLRLYKRSLLGGLPSNRKLIRASSQLAAQIIAEIEGVLV